MIPAVNKAAVLAYFEKNDNPEGLPPAYAAAKALGITRQAVEQWQDLVPELTAYKIQVLTKGKLQVDQSAYTKARARHRATAG